MSSWKWSLLSLLGAGIAFWIPDIVIPAMDRNEQGGAVTVACPFVLLLFYAILIRIRRAERTGPSTAIFAIFGMWILAPLFTMLAQTVRGNGFEGGAWSRADFRYLFISSFLPTRIFELVTLEGSIVAIWLGTVAMIICHFVFEQTRWVVPPTLWALLRRVK
jgi:hypothetical protein